MKILLFGARGQVGHEITDRQKLYGVEVIGLDYQEVDIADQNKVTECIRDISPELVINCAAYTAVDKAEEDSERAWKVNADGAGYIAASLRGSSARMIQISTDYVFDGKGSRTLKEGDAVSPLSVYGESKLGGEQQVMNALGDRALIVRTSSVHGQYGNNFVHTMIKLFRDREELKVVNDQIMSPTWAGWLADTLLKLSKIEWPEKIVNACGKGEVSWFGFATEILQQLKSELEQQAPQIELIPVPAVEFPRPAVRPQYSVLDCSRLESWLGEAPISWQQATSGHLADIDFGRKL